MMESLADHISRLSEILQGFDSIRVPLATIVIIIVIAIFGMVVMSFLGVVYTIMLYYLPNYVLKLMKLYDSTSIGIPESLVLLMMKPDKRYKIGFVHIEYKTGEERVVISKDKRYPYRPLPGWSIISDIPLLKIKIMK